MQNTAQTYSSIGSQPGEAGGSDLPEQEGLSEEAPGLWGPRAEALSGPGSAEAAIPEEEGGGGRGITPPGQPRA